MHEKRASICTGISRPKDFRRLQQGASRRSSSWLVRRDAQSPLTLTRDFVNTFRELAKNRNQNLYADSVIDDPALFDAIELQEVFEFPDSDGILQIEPDCGQDEANAYGVYAHLIEGGIDCGGDFTYRCDALAYGKKLAKDYGLQLNDYASDLRTAKVIRAIYLGGLAEIWHKLEEPRD